VSASRTRSLLGCHVPRTGRRLAVIASALGVVACSASPALAVDRPQETTLISRAMDGGVPNGPSTNGVLSGDRRGSNVIAFESEGSNLVPGDGNGLRDVFAVIRNSPNGDRGPWRAGRAILISRGLGGQPANGPSWGAAVDGGFRDSPSCVAFVSAASNLVPGDTNGKVDAFVSGGPGGPPKRVSTPGGAQSGFDTTQVAVNGNCRQIAFVTGGMLYVRVGKKVRSLGPGSDPSWSIGKADESDLVYTGPGGVRLSRRAQKAGGLVGPGGRNPAYNNVKRQVLTYELDRGGRTQVVWKDLGSGLRAASANGGTEGDASSRKPVIGNAGYYIAFESDASNLRTSSGGGVPDANGAPDVYLYTGVRGITLLESVVDKGVAMPGGAQNPSMSFYANYILWDAPAPAGSGTGPRQVYMRWLGSA
jgi:TolB protein